MPADPYIDIVCDPNPEGPHLTFCEVESPSGVSITIGRWIHRPDGFRALRIRASELAALAPSKESR